jgi:hypothetical protein
LCLSSRSLWIKSFWIYFQSIDSLCGPPGPKAFPSSLEAVKKFVSEQKERMENTCKEETDKMLNCLEKNMCMANRILSTLNQNINATCVDPMFHELKYKIPETFHIQK